MATLTNLWEERMVDKDADLKKWILNCCRNVSEKINKHTPDSNGNLGSRPLFNRGMQKLVDLVITPATVPDFTIPRSYGKSPSPGHPSTSDEDMCSEFGSRGSLDRSSDLSSFPGTPIQSHKNYNRDLVDNWQRSNSEPTVADPSNNSPTSNNNFIFKRSHTISYDMIDETPEGTTNADPSSRAAMTLPHLKTKTKFGFETLTECPKTKRKESLFHGVNYSGKLNNWDRKVFLNMSKMSRSDDTLSSTSAAGSEHQRRTSSKRRNVSSLVKPLGVLLSPQQLNGGSPPSVHSPPAGRSTSLDCGQTLGENVNAPSPSLVEKRRRFMSRRPASVNSEDFPSFSPRTRSEEKCFTPTNSRRCSNNEVSLRQEELMQLWRVSAMTNTCGVRNLPPVVPEIFPSPATILPKSEYCGELKFKLSYDVQRLELTVHIMEGINLGGNTRGSNPVNAFVKVCLLPAAVQRHTTSVVKQNNDPVFDQIFTFSNISNEDLMSARFCMKIFNRERLLRKSELLGEVVLDLSELDFDLVTCHELIRDLEAQATPQELGRLQVKIVFWAKDQRLDVTLLNIKDLPRQGITGAPDSYVSLELRQPGRPDICLDSKVKKKVTAVTLNETFSFDISPKIEDLNYTCLTLTVCERELILSDRIIGDVRLGFGATEESEFEHWNNVLNMPGKEFTMWQMIMEEE